MVKEVDIVRRKRAHSEPVLVRILCYSPLQGMRLEIHTDLIGGERADVGFKEDLALLLLG